MANEVEMLLSVDMIFVRQDDSCGCHGEHVGIVLDDMSTLLRGYNRITSYKHELS